MSVEVTQKMWISVPVKLVAQHLTYDIAHDYSTMEIELQADAKGKVHLYIDDIHVFTEPGE